MSPRNPRKGEWTVSEEMVQRRLTKTGIGKEFPSLSVHIVKGFLGKSLLKFPERPIAFLHLDVDLYEGYRDGLKHLFPRIARGGIIAFDEYAEFHNEPPYNGQEKWPGCTLAVNEFFATRKEKPQKHKETGKYFVIKEKD